MRIKNWDKFQHFKDRNPPWIKLYKDILDDPDWHELEPKLCKTLVMLWLVASEDGDKNGQLPCLRKLSFRLRMQETHLEKQIQGLSGWLVFDDIDMISERYQSDAPETETETEKRQRERRTPYGEFLNVFLSEEEYKKLKQKYPHSSDALIEKMSVWLKSKGRTYKSYYAALLNWAKDEKEHGTNRKPTSTTTKRFLEQEGIS